MKKARRSAAFVIPNHIVGHELVFNHYTNKVVVGNYIATKAIKAAGKQTNGKKKVDSN